MPKRDYTFLKSVLAVREYNNKGWDKLALKDRVDHFEGLVDLLADFRTSQDNLATDEDEKNNFRLDHSVDQTREQFRLIRAEIVMARSETLQTDWELDIAGANDVLDFEVRELGIETKLLDNTSILAGRKLRVIFRLGSSDNHLARRKNQRGCLWFSDTHDNSRKTLI